MRRRNLFIMAALCVTLALSGCRSVAGDSGDTGTQNGNTGTQNESAGDAERKYSGHRRRFWTGKAADIGKNCRTRQ